MNNEEKILEVLGRLVEKVDRMETTQAEQGEALKEQGFTLKEQGKALKEQAKALQRLEATVDEIDQRSARTQILLETEIRDNIKLLFDGHALINEKLEGLAPKSRVEDLEDDVAMLKDVVKLMRQDIAELKKAQ